MQTRRKYYSSNSSAKSKSRQHKRPRCARGTRRSTKTMACEKSKCQQELDALRAQLSRQKANMNDAMRRVDTIANKVGKIGK